MARLLLLFILVPALELALLIEVGSRIGSLATIALIAGTGALGAVLARRQGLRALREIQAEVAEGRLPAGPVVDGLIILLAGALLITPGILTDAVGFLCLVPVSRGLVKSALRRWLERAVREQQVLLSVRFDDGAGPSSPGRIYDVTPDERPTTRSKPPHRADGSQQR